MANTILGWDVGGAHLKAVLIDSAGTVLEALQLACPLWKGLDQLSRAIDEVRNTLQVSSQRHAVTMTGELADIFPDRHSGVIQISYLLARKFSNISFYAGRKGFVESRDIKSHTRDIASANWLASANFAATQVKNALFVDLGSTTCDIVPLHNGQVDCRGFSDAERLQYEELVYTGVVRTPVMALAQHVSFAGARCPLVAEHFATTADIYRLTGELEAIYDLSDTADGAGKSIEESARRLARMIGWDAQDAPVEQWKALAYSLRQAQLDRLEHAAERTYTRGLLDENVAIIGAGAGRFLVKALARQMDREYMDINAFIAAETPQRAEIAAVCFPAYAVAQLARKNIA